MGVQNYSLVLAFSSFLPPSMMSAGSDGLHRIKDVSCAIEHEQEVVLKIYCCYKWQPSATG
jgi:hypothetical protein